CCWHVVLEESTVSAVKSDWPGERQVGGVARDIINCQAEVHPKGVGDRAGAAAGWRELRVGSAVGDQRAEPEWAGRVSRVVVMVKLNGGTPIAKLRGTRVRLKGVDDDVATQRSTVSHRTARASGINVLKHVIDDHRCARRGGKNNRACAVGCRIAEIDSGR